MAKPSAETELRNLRRDYKSASEQVRQLATDLARARWEWKKAEQESTEWKRRFDELLARVPLKEITADA